MQIVKEARTGAGAPVDAGELELINRWAKGSLKAEEVYTFGLVLCDNEVDRDWERFDGAALEKLGQLFLGKSGLFDHNWSALGQTARIYRTELCREPGVLTAAGDPYQYLKAYAYLLRTEKNRDLIAEIEGGIKKEVSVGCAVGRAVCSICGEEAGGRCGHEKGQQYGGKLCFAELKEPTDAYEWSFVAVPAQRRAGVTKAMGQKEETSMELKGFLERQPGAEVYRKELERLEQEAALGRRWMEELRHEVVRLGTLTESGLDKGLLERVAAKLDEEELRGLKQLYESRVDKLFPPVPQLNGTKHRDPRQASEEYRI